MGLCPPIQDLGKSSLEQAWGSAATRCFPHVAAECLQSDKCQPTLTWPTAPQTQAGQRNRPRALRGPRRPSRESPPPVLSRRFLEPAPTVKPCLPHRKGERGQQLTWGGGASSLPCCPGSHLRTEAALLGRAGSQEGSPPPTLVMGTAGSGETPA